jgi:hypothetical protein
MSTSKTDPVRILLLLLFVLGNCTVPSNADEPIDRGWVPGRVIEVPVDSALLGSFRGEKRKRLLQYLASNAIWRVTGDQYEREISNAHRTPKWEHDSIASLRLTPPFFEGAIGRYYETAVSDFGRDPINLTICGSQNTIRNAQTREQYSFAQTHPSAPAVFGIPRNWNMQIRLVIKGDQDPVDQNAVRQQGNTAKIQMSTWSGVGTRLSQSELEVRGPEVSIVIHESSEAPETTDPYLTRKALTFVQEELKKVSAAIDKSADFDEGLFATGSVKHAQADSFQYSYKMLTGYANPGKAGNLTAHCGGAGAWSILPFLAGGSDETIMCGWSNDSNRKFYFAVPFYFNSGDGPGTGFKESDFNYELRFSPLDGSGNRILWKMNGAQIGSANKSNADKAKEIESLLESSKELQRLGRLEEAEAKLKTAFQIADDREGLRAFEQSNPVQTRAVNSAPRYQLSWNALDRLASFYIQSLMFDRARSTVLRLQALENKMRKSNSDDLIYRGNLSWRDELKRWRQLVEIDLGQSNFKNALDDSQKLSGATKTLSKYITPPQNDGERNADPIIAVKEISQKLSVMIGSQKLKGAINNHIKQSDLVSLLNNSKAVLICRIDGWKLSNGYWCGIGGKRVFERGTTDVYITPLRVFTPGLPGGLSKIYLRPDNWEEPASAANALLQLQSNHQNALIFCKKQPSLTRIGEYVAREMTIPCYFKLLAVLPASADNIRALEQLTRQSASMIPER